MSRNPRRSYPGRMVREALAVQREVEQRWKRHKLLCRRCSTKSPVLQAMCADGIALKADLTDAASVVESRREAERLAAMDQPSLFSDDELAGLQGK